MNHSAGGFAGDDEVALLWGVGHLCMAISGILFLLGAISSTVVAGGGCLLGIALGMKRRDAVGMGSGDLM